MTKFAAQVKNWSEKATRNMELVAKGAISDVVEVMTRRQASIKETGTYMEGFVPVDEGALIDSQIAAINGSVVAAGDIDHEAYIAGVEIGDIYEAGFTADHARHMEYGFTHTSGTIVPGRFFVRNALQNWQSIVDANAAMIGG